ncbi:hypothetical protein EXN66_Car011269 [Channa argus]|uniref:Uncharacterized protein n=1 Tax=Channa argus TaxID=215402 RepID=A0A6G1PZM0_CHAAH|nr:hypothetical protein EXN66_Car011269 [Channa argus]
MLWSRTGAKICFTVSSTDGYGRYLLPALTDLSKRSGPVDKIMRGRHKQWGQSNQGGNPPQSGRSGYPSNYPRQQGGGGYSNQYPAQGFPHGGYGGYPGSYINHNPNNKVLSPRYGGSLGYGGYGARGGSPFSHSVQAMGRYPSDESRYNGRRAVMAAAGGAMAGMALGYGLGRFPRPHFSFHSPQEEYYYNHYMYRKYGVKSTDTNDYSRDYKYTPHGETYDSYMDTCMNRPDLPAENQEANNKPVVTSAQDTGTSSNTTKTNSTATENSATIGPRPGNEPEASPVPPASQTVSEAEDDDTVSIVEIGYPALIEQLKARRCLELYMVYSEKYLKREAGGAQGLEMGFRGLLSVVASILLMLLNSNMLLH